MLPELRMLQLRMPPRLCMLQLRMPPRLCMIQLRMPPRLCMLQLRMLPHLLPPSRHLRRDWPGAAPVGVLSLQDVMTVNSMVKNDIPRPCP